MKTKKRDNVWLVKACKQGKDGIKGYIRFGFIYFKEEDIGKRFKLIEVKQ